jgi:hypothetical protein
MVHLAQFADASKNIFLVTQEKVGKIQLLMEEEILFMANEKNHKKFLALHASRVGILLKEASTKFLFT